MSASKFLCVAGLLVSAAFGKPLHQRSPFVVKDSHPVPAKWTQLGRAASDHVVELRIALKQGQFEDLERHLYEGTRTKSSHCVIAANRNSLRPISCPLWQALD